MQVAADQHTGGSVELSPLDIASIGRATPMVWFFRQTLDVETLLSTLQTVLAAYPILCGRYDGKAPPAAVQLTNAGVKVHISTASAPLAEAVAHLPHEPSHTLPSYFAKETHEPFLPAKAGIDPDPATADVPLMSIKITKFPGGGTAIGQLTQHGVCDADCQIQFFRNWSRCFRGLGLDPAPIHDRGIVNSLSMGERPKGELPANFKSKAVPAAEMGPPAFAPVMPKIGGPSVVIVPFPKARLQEMVAAAKALFPDVERWSTDDVLTATVWQASDWPHLLLAPLIAHHSPLAAACRSPLTSTSLPACSLDPGPCDPRLDLLLAGARQGAVRAGRPDRRERRGHDVQPSLQRSAADGAEAGRRLLCERGDTDLDGAAGEGAVCDEPRCGRTEAARLDYDSQARGHGRASAVVP